MINRIDTDFPLAFEDEWLFVIEKPGLIHSVISQNSEGRSLAGELIKRNSWLDSVSEKHEDAGLVQRLDFETSGLLLAAKDRATWLELRRILKAGELNKHYLAVVEGRIEEPTTVAGYIGSPNRGASKVRVYEGKPAKRERALPARTILNPIKYYADLEATLIEADAPTARRHQIRAHAAHSGHPLIGDAKYGSIRKLPSAENKSVPSFILHAYSICFQHPVTKMNVELKAKLPQYGLGIIYET